MSEFKVGDKVVVTQKVWGEEPWVDICYVFGAHQNGTSQIVGCNVDISVLLNNTGFRHATPEEIAAGHRIDCETLDKPENHISPNCKVEDV